MRFRNSKGFTLIELLIVIALIGVLAVALLSTINPLEQTRKAKDSARKAAAEELLNSVERFQATFFCYPQDYTVGATTPCAADPTEGPVTINDGVLETNLTTTSNEMKLEFFDRDVVTDSGDHKLVMTVDTNGLVHVCFAPESQTFTAEACKTSAGVDAGSCGEGNYVCVPE